MTPIQIILSGLALSYCWVNIVYPKTGFPKVKPFNCVTCMSGWFSMALSILNGHTFEAILFLAVGVLAGSIYESIQMRYL